MTDWLLLGLQRQKYGLTTHQGEKIDRKRRLYNVSCNRYCTFWEMRRTTPLSGRLLWTKVSWTSPSVVATWPTRFCSRICRGMMYLLCTR